MNCSINLYCRPTPLMSAVSGLPVVVQIDEAGRVQADEAGNILQPDPEVLVTHGDENNHPLTDENGALNLPEPDAGL